MGEGNRTLSGWRICKQRPKLHVSLPLMKSLVNGSHFNYKELGGGLGNLRAKFKAEVRLQSFERHKG